PSPTFQQMSPATVYSGRSQLIERDGTKNRGDILQQQFFISLMRFRRHVSLLMRQPAREVFSYGGLCWLDVASPIQFSDQTSTFSFGLSLRAVESMPFAAALSCLWIRNVNHNRP